MITFINILPSINITGSYNMVQINDIDSISNTELSVGSDGLKSGGGNLNDFYMSFFIAYAWYYNGLIYEKLNTFLDDVDFLRISIIPQKIATNDYKFTSNIQLLLNKLIKSEFLYNYQNQDDINNDKLYYNLFYTVFENYKNNTNEWVDNDNTYGYLDVLYSTNKGQKPMLLNNHTDTYKLDDYFLNNDNSKNILQLSFIGYRHIFSSTAININCTFYNKNNTSYTSKSLSVASGDLFTRNKYYVFNPFPSNTNIVEGYCLITIPNYDNTQTLTYRFDIKNVCSKFDKYKLHYVDWNGAYSQIQFSYNSIKSIDTQKDKYLPINKNILTPYNSKYDDVITLTSNFIKEGDNQKFKELFTSKFVYLEEPDGLITPAVITSNNVDLTTYRESKKILNYNVTVKKGFNTQRQTI